MMAPVKEWNRCTYPVPRLVLITENRTSLLTLPSLRGCLALLGKGYAVTRLAQIEKLRATQVHYWGDIENRRGGAGHLTRFGERSVKDFLKDFSKIDVFITDPCYG